MTLNGLTNKKYVKITTNLPRGCDNVIGTEVKDTDESIVGKVIEYDKETGKATIKIKSVIWKRIAGNTGLPKNTYHEQKNS
jgi:hypothetical protein